VFAQRRLLNLAIFVVLALCGIWIYASSRIAYPPTVRLGSGSPGGRYAALAQALKPRLVPLLRQRFGAELEIVPTQGSLENISQVDDGTLHLAFYQEGAARSDSARSVINLEYEYLYWVVRRDAGLERLADLQNRRVNLGPQGSGTYALSRSLLEYYPLSDFEAFHYDFEQAAARLPQELDAAFFVAAFHAPAIAHLMHNDAVELRPLPFVPAMRLTHPWAEARTVPAMSFKRAPQPVPAVDIPTLAVKSSLIAGHQVPPALVETVIEAILETPFVHENNLLFLKDTQTTGFAHGNTQFPLHPGAQAYFHPWEPTIPSDFVESWNGIVGMLVLVFSGVYTAASHFSRRRDSRRQEEMMAQKNALDVYIKEIEEVNEAVSKTESAEDLAILRRRLNAINLRASADYRDERFRSSEDFSAFTAQTALVLAQIVAKIREVRE
jgi:uncharacterized protein